MTPEYVLFIPLLSLSITTYPSDVPSPLFWNPENSKTLRIEKVRPFSISDIFAPFKRETAVIGKPKEVASEIIE